MEFFEEDQVKHFVKKPNATKKRKKRTKVKKMKYNKEWN